MQAADWCCRITTASAVASVTSALIPNSTFTAPAAQVVPSTPPGSSRTKTDAGGTNFPTAAVVVVVVLCTLVGILVAYKIYVWWYRKKHRYVVPLPDVRPFAAPSSPRMAPTMSSLEAGGALGGGVPRASSTYGLMPGAASLGRVRESSWTTEGGLSEAWTPSPGMNNSPGCTSPGTPTSMQPHSALTSRSPSPFGMPSPDGTVLPSSASRASFSSASGTRRHLMFGANSVVNAPHQMRTQPSSSRLSGAPHALHSRIDIVPPTPLAPPPGSVIAMDKATLDFAPSSGIGGGSGGETESETLIDVNRFTLDRPGPTPTYDSRFSTYQQGTSSRAYSSVSGRSSYTEPRSVAPAPHHRTRSSLGSGPSTVSPFQDPRFIASSTSSSENASPNSSSTGLSTRGAPLSNAKAPAPLSMSAAAASPFPLSSEPSSPLEKLQQRIAQQARRSGTDVEISSASGSGSGSSGGRSGSVAEIEGYQAPRERLEEVMNGRALPRA
ncbi:BZ3500_MvSof-1268-A1-R1_Chr1-1g00930 [Microbotryum saponariae]|uniref:BZ3500_MvSof-1268-A1-R1_Chr1-1g00930 protein n=1 Tax=Microbotryum saponariae TaxID=289078 RepID=A0A2X0KC75_9BASI|nr:BZ3500_MvSof-1268-A1-R1_Chr1-1g00930 [Microbotryum saponariae]SCZ92963.1 BZ3501_MvSof-1269-A2-R1_Chr1-1g00527 [Microbotryum saponariae]